MNPIRRLRSLMAATVTAAVLSSTPLWARDFTVRSRVAVEDAAVQALEAGEGRVRVLIVAKEARGSVSAFGANVVEARRAKADASTAEIMSIIQEGADAFGAFTHGAPDPTYLWAANTVVADVDADTLERLQSAGSVERILLDREVQVLDLEEGEPVAEEDIPTNYGVAKIRADEARHQGLDGSGVKVGIIDTGADADHPALAGKVKVFKDFVQGKTEAYDDQGHGSHCAGTIAGEGGIGIAPKSELIVAKALNRRGGGTLSGLLEAMQWMLDPDGNPATNDQPDLVSNSWGADADAMGDSRELFRDIVTAWRQAGIVPVFAAGNSGPNTRAVPGGYPESFAVGATDKNDGSASFSTGGPIEFDGETFLKPDVSAPGVRIISVSAGGGYRALNGTSMACPHVAGAMALAFQAKPGTGVAAMIEAFQAGSVDLGDEGRDARFGEGRVDVVATLQALGASAAQAD